jgi:hypothetical protein
MENLCTRYYVSEEDFHAIFLKIGKNPGKSEEFKEYLLENKEISRIL